jgi:glucan phosphoethanolaminetransferase (alkaline phosphatase superfamily)
MVTLFSFVCFLVCLAFYSYVMARYEEFMTNREIFNVAIATPARVAWGFGMKCLDFIAGFAFGPIALLIDEHPGSYSSYPTSSFDYGRFAFQIVACVGGCLGAMGFGLLTAGLIVEAAYRWLVG